MSTAKIELVNYINFLFRDLIKIMLDDRHSRLSLLRSHSHLPRNMYYVPARGRRGEWIWIEADGTAGRPFGG